MSNVASIRETGTEIIGLTQENILLMSTSQIGAAQDFFKKLFASGEEETLLDNYDILLPAGKRLYKIMNHPESKIFIPENGKIFYAGGQKENAPTGANLLEAIYKENANARRIMGAEHLRFYLENWWRVPEEFKMHSVSFFGTVYANQTKLADNLDARDLFVWVLDWDHITGRPVARTKTLANNFDQHYPVAVKT